MSTRRPELRGAAFVLAIATATACGGDAHRRSELRAETSGHDRAKPGEAPPVPGSTPSATSGSPSSTQDEPVPDLTSCPAHAPLNHDEAMAMARTANVKLEMPSSVKLGDRIALRLRNTEDFAHCGYIPGGSLCPGNWTGDWTVRLRAASGREYRDFHPNPSAVCLAAERPPSWFEIRPGGVVELELAPNKQFYVFHPPGSDEFRDSFKKPQPVRSHLPRGSYQVTVRFPGVEASGNLTVR